MPSSQIERKLAAIMFTDIAGYTALSAKDENKALELLDTQKQILTPIIEKFNGTLHKEMGDGLLFTFPTVTEAVKCGIKIQEETKANDDLNLRIGIHEGEITLKDGDALGDDVNVASRIESFAPSGGIAISSKVQQNISSLPEFETSYIGKPELKGVAQKVEVYCITSHGLPKTAISKVTAKLEDKSNFNIYTLTGGILTAIGIAFWIAVGVFDVSFGGRMEVPSVGILMMENLGKEDEEFWSSGMTNDLITKVAGAGLIRVAPLDDILKLDKDLTIEEKAKKLRVKYILTHSFLIKNDGFDLWCKLENVENGVALFSNKISESMDMATQMVGKLANDIVSSLKVKTKQDVIKAPTTNAEAYEFYLKAKYIHEKREDMQDTEISRGLYRKAIELDDNLIEAKTSLGWTYFETGDYDKAMDIYTSALKQAEELGNKSGIGASLKGIGDVHQIKGDYDNALDDYGRQFKILEELADKRGIGASLNNIGGVYFNKGDYEKALNYYERSLTILEEIDDKQGMGYNLNTIGIVYAYKGDHEKAIEYHERSLKIDEELGDKGGMGWSLNNIGDVYKSQGNYEKAMEYYERSLAIQEERGNKSWIGRSLIKIGNVHDIKSDHEKALDYYERSLKILEELGDKYGIGASLKSIGDLYSNKGDSAKALDYYNRSRKIKEELSNP